MSIGPLSVDEPLDVSPSLSEAGILVVDPDPAFQLGLKTFLREYVGFENVFTARKGEDALEKIVTEETIQVVTLESRLPDMMGLVLLERLAAASPRPLCVVMITASPSRDLEEQFRAMNSSQLLTTHFLTKPVDFEKLEPLILRSYEELKAAQRLTKTLSGESGEDTSPVDPDSIPDDSTAFERLLVLEAKLKENTEELAKLKNRLLTIQQRFWLGLLKWATLAVMIWLALEFAAFDKARTWIRNYNTPPQPNTEELVPETPRQTETPKQKNKSDTEGTPL